MIAALPMYDRPELHAAHDALWSGIRDALRSDGIGAPEVLRRDLDVWDGWQAPDLVLGQTCGLPLRTVLCDRVTLVATFDYGLADTPPGFYRSTVVARRDDPRDLAALAAGRLAINDAMSHSGWSTAYMMATEKQFAYGAITATGSHRKSAQDVADGFADIAFIDEITLRGLRTFDPNLMQRLRYVARSGAAPGQALITARGIDPQPIRRAVQAGLAALPVSDAKALGIKGVVDISLARYRAEPDTPRPGNMRTAA